MPGQEIIDTLKSYFGYIISFFTDIAKYIKDYLNYVVDYWVNFYNSMKDFILDLPAILLEYATDFMVKFLDWAAGYCAYCLGFTPQGGVAGISIFAQKLQEAYNALSPCVIYALTQSGIVGDLQTLSCAMIVWAAFRVASLVKSIA